MLSDKEFKDWCSRLELSPTARAEIEHIRSSPPARRVQGGAGNVARHFNRSTIMPHTIQSESRTVEYPALLIMHLKQDDVLEIWDQPNSFTIRYQDASGKKKGHIYTADFFVIRKDSAGWEEWKPENKLISLSEANSNRYYKDEHGKWRCPPCEEYAFQFRLYFHVHSSSEINYTFIRNAELLMPVYCYLRRSNG
jgi:hypothetical protein